MTKIRRSLLETQKTPSEMREIIASFAHDCTSYTTADVHRRKGIIKEIIEEYRPLSIFACHYPGVLGGRLTISSNNGPDAEVFLNPDRRKLAIQITTAGESHNTALGREQLAKVGITFTNTSKSRCKEGLIRESGRVLTTRKGVLLKQVDQIIRAISLKINKFHEGADVLLVGASIYVSDPDDYSWKSDLIDQVSKLNIPYDSVYLANCASKEDMLIKLK